MKKSIRETKSLCPLCNNIVDAKVLEGIGEISLFRHCPQHGVTEAFLAESCYYKELDEFYFSLIKNGKKKQKGAAELFITFKCNMDCPVCFLGDKKKRLIDFDPTLGELEEFIKNSQEEKIVLTGGEPTLREDLFEIIRIIKKYNKSVALKSNGLKLADMDYVRELEKAGIDEIEIQFSGFDPRAEEYLRGINYIPSKLKALENLKKARISTKINTLIAGGINEEQIHEIIHYAFNNIFIKMVNFGTLQFVGNAKGLPRNLYLMPDDILRIIEKQTAGKIKRKEIYLFKKLEITISSFLNRTTCLYNFVFIAVRGGREYETISKYINLERIEPFLNRYRNIYIHNIFFAKAYLFLVAPLILIFYTRPTKILRDFLVNAIILFSKGHYFSGSDRFIYFLSTVECDPYRMDYAIYRNCPLKVFHFFDEINNSFVRRESAIKGLDWLLRRTDAY